MVFVIGLVAALAAVAVFANDTGTQLVTGIGAAAVAVVAGCGGVLLLLKTADVPAKDLIDLLREAKEVIAELVKVKSDVGDVAGEGGGGRPQPTPRPQPGR
jgi:hypothetical protein